MTYRAPYGSSSPSTPEKNRSFLSNISTTPAGPPPSSVYGASQGSSSNRNSLFTRSGGLNLDDSIFGSSIGSSDFALSRKNNKNGTGAKSSFTGPQRSRFGATNNSRLGESTSFSFSNSFDTSQMSENAEEDVGDDTEAQSEEDEAEDTERTNRGSINLMSFQDSHLGESSARQSTSLGQRKSIYSNLSNSKRPKLDERRAAQTPISKLQPLPNKDSPMPSIVRGFASRSRVAAVEEPGNMIINTEDAVSQIYDGAKQTELQNGGFGTTLSKVSSNLVAIWESFAEQNKLPRPYGAGSIIGPGEGAPAIAKAGFLGSLLLQLHHPPLSKDTSGGLSNHGGLLVPRGFIPMGKKEPTLIPLPRFLLDWLNTNHVPQPGGLDSLEAMHPNPTVSSDFWEIIIAAVLRGHLSEVAEVLRLADFNYARSAMEDGLPQAGYRGTQLQNIQRCVNKALQVLDICPGVQKNDWDVKGAEWAQYRKRVEAAVTDLEEFAEGEDNKQAPESPAKPALFQAVNFGLSSNAPQNNVSFTQSSRMAESRVPWTIYQNLRSLYRILLGDTVAITAHVQDWVEATIALTVWWDGDDGSETSSQSDKNNAFGASTAGDIFQLASKATVPRAVDIDPEGAYVDRLNLAFRSVTGDASADTGFRVNSLRSLEVGLASVFEGDVEGVVELLQTWSLCVASAVTEVASAGDWLETAAKASSDLDENDLMVLSYGQDDRAAGSRVRKDDVLSAYASGLYERPSVRAESVVKDGWEIALQVLSRLDDSEKMQKTVTELVDKLPLDTSDQMDKVVLLCSDLGLDKEGRRVSEVSFFSFIKGSLY